MSSSFLQLKERALTKQISFQSPFKLSTDSRCLCPLLKKSPATYFNQLVSENSDHIWWNSRLSKLVLLCALWTVNRKNHEIRNECEKLNKRDVIKKCISQLISARAVIGQFSKPYVLYGSLKNLKAIFVPKMFPDLSPSALKRIN